MPLKHHVFTGLTIIINELCLVLVFLLIFFLCTNLIIDNIANIEKFDRRHFLDHFVIKIKCVVITRD